ALDADVGLVDAGPVDHERVRDDDVEGLGIAGAGELPHAIAEHLAAAELALVAVDREVAFDLGDEPGVAAPYAVTAGRAVHLGLRARVQLVAHGASLRSVP